MELIWETVDHYEYLRVEGIREGDWYIVIVGDKTNSLTWEAAKEAFKADVSALFNDREKTRTKILKEMPELLGRYPIKAATTLVPPVYRHLYPSDRNLMVPPVSNVGSGQVEPIKIDTAKGED